MNGQQIPINRRWVTSLLLAGLILVVTAGIAWVDASINQTNREVTADAVEYDSGLPSESELNSVKGGKIGVQGGDE